MNNKKENSSVRNVDKYSLHFLKNTFCRQVTHNHCLKEQKNEIFNCVVVPGTIRDNKIVVFNKQTSFYLCFITTFHHNSAETS